ncbi:SEFIR domain-containing protein [Streptomyces cyaneus]|uniref:SEFIR domain-containing protein n=1 Tax=Streptomyces cyaneus TaxID=1904 RepID=UPI0013E3088E|nr:SEFIR domain-containing protein [Streptomyces cyaneus]
MSDVSVPGRVFISYAHDDAGHIDKVRDFYHFLRRCGIDADLDLPAGERRRDWALWMLRGIRDSRHVIVVASPEYKRRAEGDAAPGEGKGVQWESMLLRNLVYEDHAAALEKIVPVVLPEGSAKDLPVWLGGSPTGHYAVEGFAVDGAEKLLRLLTGQPYETEPPLGPKPVLAPREPVAAATPLVLHPPVTASAPVPPPDPPPPTFVMPEPKDLIDALMACRKLRQLYYRHELLEMMSESLGGPDYVFDVPESAEARTHLRALDGRIRRTTLMADAVLKVMYLALEEIAPDDIGTKRVRELLVACGLVLGEA